MLCCGYSGQGQLGMGASEREIYGSLVVNEALSTGCKQVSSGVNHTLFLLDDGSVLSCGSNDFGQLGHHKTKTRPHKVDALCSVECVQVGCGLNFSAALSVDGRLFLFGMIDELLHFKKPSFVKGIEGKVLQFAVGYNHVLALSESGRLFALGQNSCGQLGVGAHHKLCKEPVSLTGCILGVPIYQMACGAYHSVLISKSGYVFTFGSAKFGELGLNRKGQCVFEPEPVKHLYGQKARYVACGQNHTVIITLNGGVFSFGNNSHGQLGHGSKMHEMLPRKVFELMGSSVSQVACGRCHTLAFMPESGRVYAFGNSANGQLGIEYNPNRASLAPSHQASPTAVPLNFTPFGAHRRRIDSGGCIVTSIFAGGDQTFIRFSTANHPRSPVDYRFLNARRQIKTLNVTYARELTAITAKESRHVSSELINSLQLIFAYSACLNASFFSNDKQRSNEHFDTDEKRHGIDAQEVVDFFEKLREVNDFVERTLARHIKTMLFAIHSQKENFSFEALRVFVTLPFCHLMENSDYLE